MQSHLSWGLIRSSSSSPTGQKAAAREQPKALQETKSAMRVAWHRSGQPFSVHAQQQTRQQLLVAGMMLPSTSRRLRGLWTSSKELGTPFFHIPGIQRRLQKLQRKKQPWRRRSRSSIAHWRAPFPCPSACAVRLDSLSLRRASSSSSFPTRAQQALWRSRAGSTERVDKARRPCHVHPAPVFKSRYSIPTTFFDSGPGISAGRWISVGLAGNRDKKIKK